ncbi:restriction endonuclease subunit S [Methanoplanus limicola]|nr:restriction endonuclease subunit S [Methanoplanus limicola]
MKSKTDQMDKTDNGDNGDNRTISSDILTENFATITKANGGIKKLRELILQLAVQGKLVPQNPDDEPASVLLEKIKDEKQNLIKTGQIKKQKPLPPIDEDEVPYDLPEGWIWTRLGTVTNYNGRKKIPPSDLKEDYWLLELEDIEKGSSKVIKRLCCGERSPKSTKSSFKTGDVLYGKLRPYLDKVIVADTDGYCTTEIVPIIQYYGIIPNYIRLFLKSPEFIKYVNSKTYGVKMPRLGTSDAINTFFPLPPLAEQHRIVERVDCLMKLCDDLESRQESESENRRLLLLSVLKNLEDAGSEDEKQEAWEILSGRFDDLINSAEDVKELRKTVLQLAVQGRLVPQNPEDEPASVLLEKIKDEKQNLIKTGWIKKQKALPPVDEDEIPYALPEGWIWVKIPKITHNFGQKVPDKPFNYIDVSSINKEKGKISLDENIIQPKDAPSRARKIAKINSVIYSTVRPYLLNIAIIDQIFEQEFIVSTAFAVLHPHKGISNRFLYYYLRSSTFIKYVESQMTGMAYPAISESKFNNGIIPLPPLAEQHRIVERVDCLMKLCDELEERVVAQEESAERLLSSVCAGICG